MFDTIYQLAISTLERCPSGLRSTIGNRVSAERWIVGSNPTLSAGSRKLVIHTLKKKGELCIIMAQKHF